LAFFAVKTRCDFLETALDYPDTRMDDAQSVETRAAVIRFNDAFNGYDVDVS
jgi:hypothetical protein